MNVLRVIAFIASIVITAACIYAAQRAANRNH